MRGRLSSLALLAFAGLLAIPLPAAAQTPSVSFTVDENGNGTVVSSFFPGTTFPTIGVLQPDPGPGGLSSALTYNLLGPPSLVAGDVILLEPAAASTSDIIRFNPAGTGSANYPASLVFYSDNLENDALADTGFPSADYSDFLLLAEVGSEGSNGFTYTPTAGEPGFVADFSVTYNKEATSRQFPNQHPSSWSAPLSSGSE